MPESSGNADVLRTPDTAQVVLTNQQNIESPRKVPVAVAPYV